ncbi:hypothetical protein CEXT_794261 [Caerostris extrusa]|uniref:Uncharacterized protein n=1 Tax=Caerostris extrusa TaxID=172846 RepID=A0AAV4SQA4_CAEEX|nr:hypothetical protein CEXT_794261 [Caerostris extrusa]
MLEKYDLTYFLVYNSNIQLDKECWQPLSPGLRRGTSNKDGFYARPRNKTDVKRREKQRSVWIWSSKMQWGGNFFPHIAGKNILRILPEPMFSEFSKVG